MEARVRIQMAKAVASLVPEPIPHDDLVELIKKARSLVERTNSLAAEAASAAMATRQKVLREL